MRFPDLTALAVRQGLRINRLRVDKALEQNYEFIKVGETKR